MKKGWEVKKLGNIIVENKKSTIKVRDSSEEGNYIFFTSGEKTKRFDKNIVEGENIFLATGGKAVINYYNGKAAYSTDTYSIKGLKNCANTQYLYFIILSQIERIESKMFQGAAIKHLQKNEFKKIKIPLSPLSEQKRIVKILDDAFNAIDKAKENIEKNINNSKELFESYLNNIFDNPGEDWEEKRLGDVYDVRDGTHDSPKYHREGYALITSKNLKEGKIDYKNVKYISKKDYENINKRSKVHKGDILFAMIGTIGNPVIIEEDPNFAIKNVALFKIPENQNNSFLKYFLNSKVVIGKMTNEAKGTTQRFVGLGYLRNFIIKLPKINEQKNIVSKLDMLSEKTKKLEKNYKKKLKDLEEMKKSILQKAFNGEL
jgi:type I restriction enzyme, S subunit